MQDIDLFYCRLICFCFVFCQDVQFILMQDVDLENMNEANINILGLQLTIAQIERLAQMLT